MTENLSSNQYHQIQHFISDSPWSARELMDSVAYDIAAIFKDAPTVGLLIDETSEDKKGDKSVGVSHQYCGSLGKQSNCQVAVFASLCAGEHFSIVDAQLYMPKNWCEDADRRKEAGVPEEIVYKKKANIALDMIKSLASKGVRFDYVSADALYGHDAEFRAGLDTLGILFTVDTHKNTKFYEEEFQFEVPPKKQGARGTAPSVAKPNKVDMRMDSYLNKLQAKDFEKVRIRNGCKGLIVSYVHAMEVFINEDGICKKRVLIIRKTKEEKTERIHFILSNADLATHNAELLVGCQSQRYYVEQSFRECKQNIGMCEYQVRGWRAWHHHIALSMMALAFMAKEKWDHKEKLQLLTLRDIRDAIISQYMEEYIPLPFEEKLAIRHQKRQKDINRYYKKIQT